MDFIPVETSLPEIRFHSDLSMDQAYLLHICHAVSICTLPPECLKEGTRLHCVSNERPSVQLQMLVECLESTVWTKPKELAF